MRIWLLSLTMLWFACAQAAETFPAQFPGVDIGVNLTSQIEPSGLAWQPRLQRLLLCSDSNRIVRMDRDGNDVSTWIVAGNWEGIAIADPAGAMAYVVDEDLAVIKEINIETGSVSARSFSLTTATATPGVSPLTAADIEALLDSGDGAGVEALTFVPIAGAPEGGEFWAGSQQTGEIFRFRLSLQSGNSVIYLGKYFGWPLGVPNEMRGLEYDWARGGIIYALFGSSRILALNSSAGVLADWFAPPNGNNKEGVASDNGNFFIGLDPAVAHTVWMHSNFTSVPANLWFANGFED